jgi:hypothetical protein
LYKDGIIKLLKGLDKPIAMLFLQAKTLKNTHFILIKESLQQKEFAYILG